METRQWQNGQFSNVYVEIVNKYTVRWRDENLGEDYTFNAYAVRNQYRQRILYCDSRQIMFAEENAVRRSDRLRFVVTSVNRTRSSIDRTRWISRVGKIWRHAGYVWRQGALNDGECAADTT